MNTALIDGLFFDSDNFQVLDSAKADSSDHDARPAWLLVEHFKELLASQL